MLRHGVTPLGKQARPPSPPRSNFTACLRCHQRKKRCDRRLPACRLCEAAGVECVGYDSVSKRQIPRSYVHSLETLVASLQLKLQQHGIECPELGTESQCSIPRPHPSEPIAQPSSSPAYPLPDSNFATSQTKSDAAAKTLIDVQKLLRPSTAPEPIFSKMLISGLLKSPKPTPTMPVISPHDIILEKQFDRTPSPRPLPDRKSADYFVNMFFQYVNFSVPMLHEPTLRAKLDCLYSETTLEDDGINVDRQLDKFFVNMVFSVGLLAVHKQDSPRIPIALCEQYCQTALLALEAVPFPRTVEGVQALTLLAQYSYLHPAEYGGWNTIGMALQLAVELGLHQDPCSEDLDCLTLDMMRRSFWAAYSMDRSAAIAIGRPKYLSDGFITAKYPSDADDEYITTGSATQPEGIPRGKKRYCIHWLRYRQLQSEIHTVLYERMPSLYSQVDYARWQNTMAEDIRSWYNAVLQESRPSEIGSSNIAPPEILELAFQLALMLIYRPSPNNPAPSDPALSALATCSMEVNQLYKRFFRENKVRFYWHAVENVFNAGTSLIYAYAHSAAVREQYSRRSLDAAIHSTSSVLWAMVEHFPAFKGRRDAFEVIASKTLADFGEHNATEGSSLASHASFPPTNVEYRDGKMTMSHSNNKAGLGASQVDEESDSPRHNNPFGTGRILLGDEEEASYLALPVNMGGPDMHSSDLSMLNAEAFDIDENLDFDKVSTNWDEMTYATWL